MFANVQKLVRKLTYSLTNVRHSAVVCKLILANVQEIVRKLIYFPKQRLRVGVLTLIVKKCVNFLTSL